MLTLVLAAAGPVAHGATASVPQVQATQGDAQAQFERGLALLCGTRVARDPVQAARWVGLAAEQGHLGAQSVLGWMAMSGTGMPQDDTRAAPWLRRAAERGDTAAQNNLGVLYAIGAGVEHDHAQAERWFRAAAEQGAADAARNLVELRRRSGAPAPQVTHAALHPALVAAGCRPAR
jgi:TPR repeat protein